MGPPPLLPVRGPRTVTRPRRADGCGSRLSRGNAARQWRPTASSRGVTAHSGRGGLASELTSRGASTTAVMLAGELKDELEWWRTTPLGRPPSGELWRGISEQGGVGSWGNGGRGFWRGARPRRRVRRPVEPLSARCSPGWSSPRFGPPTSVVTTCFRRLPRRLGSRGTKHGPNRRPAGTSTTISQPY